MRYLLAYLLPPPIRDEHLALELELAKRFRITPEYEKIEPHLTLKTPFDTDDIAPVESLIETFTQKHRAEPLTLSGFGFFRRDVVFVNVHAPRETLDLLTAFTNELSHVPRMALTEHDRARKLHATLARGFGDQFDALWRYVTTQKVHFETLLDNISLLQFPGSYPWQLVRRFELRPQLQTSDV